MDKGTKIKRIAIATLASGICINLSEFLRNELLFKQHWVAHYKSLGLAFPSAPANGALWGLWGFLFAGCIVPVRRHMSCWSTIILSWSFGFFLMWIVASNLGVLPLTLLSVAAPWSLGEVVLATVITQSILKKSSSHPESEQVSSEAVDSEEQTG